MSDVLFHQRDLHEERSQRLVDRVPVFDHPPRRQPNPNIVALCDAIGTAAMLLSKGYQQRGICFVRLGETSGRWPSKLVEIWYMAGDELKHVAGSGRTFIEAHAAAIRARRRATTLRPLEDFEDGDVAPIPQHA